VIRCWIGALACLFLTACEGVVSGPDLERMIDQRKFNPFARSRFFDDGRAMRVPPADTVPHDGPVWPAAIATGRVGERDLARVPLPVDRALLERGRDRFEVYCAACHGADGSGRSPVASVMELKPPPSLIDPPTRDLSPGHIFRVATEGYGLMPSYGGRLDVRDRWAVVAYLKALALSQRATLGELPPGERAAAERALSTRAGR
jgi:mono/diheme cytochrome c family protein